VPNPKKEAEILLGEVTGLDKIGLYSSSCELNKKKQDKLKGFVQKRLKGIPYQYIIKRAFFYGLEFRISGDTFIPRPETELLVENILKLLSSKRLDNPLILDIGTGCGNLAISLTKSLSSCKMTAVDVSKTALKVAKQNAARHGVSNSITFLKGDLFKALRHNVTFDVIVSNPPYISISEYKHLQQEVKKEPKNALLAGKDGLLFYKIIIKVSVDYLKPGGYLILEIDSERAEKIIKIATENMHYLKPKVIKDYNGKDRVLIIQKTK
jgi:release factor glutamine methyltransferase